MLLDDLLRTAGEVPDPDPRALDAARRRLRRRPLWQRPAVLAAAAGVAALALVVPVTGLPGSGGSAAEAAVVLRQAARAAAAQPGGWPDAAYWWVRSQNDCNGRQTDREIWLGHTGPGVLKDTQFPGEPEVPLDGEARFAAGGSDVDWDELYALPTEPSALERRLRDGIDGAGPDDDTEVFVIVGDLLRESPAPPALRGALYEVAARVPGVRLEGPTTDATGRPGQAVSRGKTTYVFDPADGRLLEDRSPGCRLTFLESGPAERPGVRP